MPAYFTAASGSPLARWWSARSASAQRRLQWSAIAAFLFVAIVVVAQPAARSADATRAALARDASALADARVRAGEIATLERTSRPPAADPKAALERVIGQAGLRERVTQLEWQNERARLTFADVEFDALVRILESLQREANLRVVDAKLAARVEPGTVRAELTLGR
jgi:type II secretory pathway component PulM